MPAKPKAKAKASGTAPKGKGKVIKLGSNFQQPSAKVMGEQPGSYATEAEKAKGIHPTTNKPVFTGMATLEPSQSPSRVGFEHFNQTGTVQKPTGNAAAAVNSKESSKTKAKVKKAKGSVQPQTAKIAKAA